MKNQRLRNDTVYEDFSVVIDGSERKFSVDSLKKYLDSQEKAKKLVDYLIEQISSLSDNLSGKSSEIADKLGGFLEIASVCLYANGFEEEFCRLNRFEPADKKSNININAKSFLGFYYSEKYLQFGSPTDLEEINTIFVDNILHFLNNTSNSFWLMKLFYDLNVNDLEGSNQNVQLLSMHQKSLRNFDTDILSIVYEGFVYYAREDYNSALERFVEIFARAANAIPLIRFAIGMCLMKLDRKEEALQAFKATLIKDPDNITAKLMKNQLVKELDPDRDSEDITVSDGFNEKNVAYLSHLAFTKIKQRKPDEAIEILEGLRLNHKNNRSKNKMILSELCYKLAVAYHSKGDFKTARSLYREAYENNTKHFYANYASALFEYSNDNISEVTKILDAVGGAELGSSYEAYTVLGLACTKKFRESNDIEYAEKARNYLVQADENSRNTNYQERHKILKTLGWLCIKLQKFDEARQYFEETRKVLSSLSLPVDDQTLIFLGVAQYQRRMYKEALITYSEVSDQDSPILCYNKALCEEHLGNITVAKQMYMNLKDKYPHFTESYIRLGCIERKLHNQNADIYWQVIYSCKDPLISNIQKHKAMLHSALLFYQYAQDVIINTDNIKNKERFDKGLKLLSHSVAKVDRILNDEEPDGKLFAKLIKANSSLLRGQGVDKDREYELNRAKDQFLDILNKNPNCDSAACGLATVYLALNGRNASSFVLDALSSIVESNSTLKAPVENLSHAYFEADRFEDAAKNFNKTNETFYDRTDARLFYAEYKALMKIETIDSYQRAIRASQYMISLEPDRSYYWYCQGKALRYYIATKDKQARNKKERPTTFERLMKLNERCTKMYRKYSTEERVSFDPRAHENMDRRLRESRDEVIKHHREQDRDYAERVKKENF